MNAAQLEAIKRKLIEDSEVLEFVGLSKQSIVSTRLGLMNGLQVFITTDSAGNYVYEAKIPFKAFHIKKSAVKVLGVAFVTGKLIPPKGSQTATPSPTGVAYGNSPMMGQGYNNRGGMNSHAQTFYRPVNYGPFSSSTYFSVGIKLQ